jgi:ribosomal protein L22
MSPDEKPRRRRRRKAESEEASESTVAPAGGDATSSEEGPVAPQAGVQDESSEEATSADEGPVAPQAGVQGKDSEPGAGDEAPEASGDTGEAEDSEAGEAAQPARRRRGSAETGTTQRRPPRRTPDGDVVVRAQARYVRCAPRKARLVVDHIRGKRVDEARAILRHTPRHAARDVLKLLESCVSNAENNHELVADELVVRQAYVDEGPTIRRYRPRAYGRATRINKRTSHMTLTLTPTTVKE